MTEVNWKTYDNYLKTSKTNQKNKTLNSAKDSLLYYASINPAYQSLSTRNGNIQPIIASRNNLKICDFTIMPNDEIFVGDIVECYDEIWLVMETMTDEYGITTGEMWLCNKTIHYQDYNGNIKYFYCIIDDGSYTKNNQSALPIPDNQFNMYLSKNSDTEKFSIDKRFAVGTFYDINQNKILQVMKVTWFDDISKNFGTGSHLLKLKMVTDVYNKENDNLDKMICDFISKDTTSQMDAEYSISGKDTIRIGTSRTYEILSNDGETPNNLEIILLEKNDVKLKYSEEKYILTVPLKDDLVGEDITLKIVDKNSQIVFGEKTVKVVLIG